MNDPDRLTYSADAEAREKARPYFDDPWPVPIRADLADWMQYTNRARQRARLDAIATTGVRSLTARTLTIDELFSVRPDAPAG